MIWPGYSHTSKQIRKNRVFRVWCSFRLWINGPQSHDAHQPTSTFAPNVIITLSTQPGQHLATTQVRPGQKQLINGTHDLKIIGTFRWSRAGPWTPAYGEQCALLANTQPWMALQDYPFLREWLTSSRRRPPKDLAPPWVGLFWHEAF